jgi:hypothetical protein
MAAFYFIFMALAGRVDTRLRLMLRLRSWSRRGREGSDGRYVPIASAQVVHAARELRNLGNPYFEKGMHARSCLI